METTKVGMREFRDKLATYVMNAEAPLAITRHGDTVGLYLPMRRKRSERERADFLEAAKRWQRELDAAGVNEEEVIEEFLEVRRGEREGHLG